MQYRGEALQLVQPSIWKRIYQLRTSGDSILTMTYPKLFSTSAIVEGFGEVWEIDKPSIWKSNLEIKKQHNQLPFAKFTSEKWGRGGMFELPNGGRIEYAVNLWKGYNDLLSQQKVNLVSLKRESIWKSALTITLNQESELLDKNPWLIMAVYYLMLERKQATHAA